MKATSIFSALVLAAFLYDEGFRWLPATLAVVTALEAVQDWWRSRGKSEGA